MENGARLTAGILWMLRGSQKDDAKQKSDVAEYK
jgi:hypothetical protein